MRSGTVLQVSEHVYLETKYLGCNIGVIVTEQGPIVIDTPALPDDARDLLEQIHGLTKRRIAYLIYTHEHFDHVIGSAYLTRKGIIAHQSAVSDIEYLKTNLPGEINSFFPGLYQQYKKIFDRVEIISPHITFTGAMTLHTGNLTLELSHAGGHSPASIIVSIPEERALFCGDIAGGDTPFITPYSRFDEWIAALKRLEGMDVEKIVPGHGDVCGKEAVRAHRAYFERMPKR